MAKIAGRNWSHEIPKKYTRQEFIALYGDACGGCKDLGSIYDQLVKASGVTPKTKKAEPAKKAGAKSEDSKKE